MKPTPNHDRLLISLLLIVVIINIPILVYLSFFNTTLTRSVIALEVGASETEPVTVFNGFVELELDRLCNDSFYYSEGDCVIHSNCVLDSGRKRLVKYAVYAFVSGYVEAKSDTYFEGLLLSDNDPISTYENGGDCENFAILALSVLRAYNISGLYLLYQEEHMCWEAEGVRFGCMSDRPILNLRYVGEEIEKLIHA